jgi:hypothetical protein
VGWGEGVKGESMIGLLVSGFELKNHGIEKSKADQARDISGFGCNTILAHTLAGMG